jgi:hypothetical protein
MPRKSTADRLKTLRKKREQLDNQLKALEAREQQALRKADTRRKVIAGALALEHYEKNPDSEFHRIMFRLLDEYVIFHTTARCSRNWLTPTPIPRETSATPALTSSAPAAKPDRHRRRHSNRNLL